MSYVKDLFDRAAAAAGSRYALSKLTGIPQSNLSDAAHGKRQVPLTWVLPLAAVAKVDPGEALKAAAWEAAAKRGKPVPPQSVQNGAGATSITGERKGPVSSWAANEGHAMAHDSRQLHLTVLHIVLSRLAPVFPFIRTRPLSGLALIPAA